MRAIEFTAPGRVRVTELPLPPVPPGHVRVQVGASGLCHTDLEILRGGYGQGTFPLVPGHEFAGTVTDVAEDVTHLRPGARVVVDPNLPCGTCPACRAGAGNLCPALGAYGVTCAGGFAEEAVVAATHVHDAGDMPFSRAALAEPLGCVLNGLRAAHVTAPETAAIFGAGPIGLMIALALRQRGAGRISVVDRDRTRLDLAEGMGFVTLPAGPETTAALHHSQAFAADATGVAEVVQALPETLQHGGTALVMGVCPQEARIAISPYDLFRRQLTLAGSHSLAARDLVAARDMLAAADAAFDPLVSHRVPLSDLVAFLEGRAPARHLKVHYDPAA